MAKLNDKDRWIIKAEMNTESINVDNDLSTLIIETLCQLDKPIKKTTTESGLKTFRPWHRDNRKVIHTLINMGLLDLETIYDTLVDKGVISDKADAKADKK